MISSLSSSPPQLLLPPILLDPNDNVHTPLYDGVLPDYTGIPMPLPVMVPPPSAEWMNQTWFRHGENYDAAAAQLQEELGATVVVDKGTGSDSVQYDNDEDNGHGSQAVKVKVVGGVVVVAAAESPSSTTGRHRTELVRGGAIGGGMVEVHLLHVYPGAAFCVAVAPICLLGAMVATLSAVSMRYVSLFEK